MPKLSPEAVYALARNAGFNRDDAAMMLAIAYPESALNPGVLNDTRSTGDLSYGIWQINMLGRLGPPRLKEFGIKANAELLDPYVNARAAWLVSLKGKTFTPWSTYKRGSHKPFVARAKATAEKVGEDWAKHLPGGKPTPAPDPAPAKTPVSLAAVQAALEATGRYPEPLASALNAEGFTADRRGFTRMQESRGIKSPKGLIGKDALAWISARQGLKPTP